jgi:hypothetical protein
MKTETSSAITTGDLNMGNAAQTLPPVKSDRKSDKKKEVKKTDQVWISLPKAGGFPGRLHRSARPSPTEAVVTREDSQNIGVPGAMRRNLIMLV